MTAAPPLAYFWGEDAFSIDRAARAYTERITPPGETMEVFRTGLDDAGADGEEVSASLAKRRTRVLDDVEAHLSMAPLFGAGTLVLLRQPAGLLAEKASRERLLGLVAMALVGMGLWAAQALILVRMA